MATQFDNVPLDYEEQLARIQKMRREDELMSVEIRKLINDLTLRNLADEKMSAETRKLIQ